MCAAAKSDPETACRCRGHFRGAIWGPLSLTLYSVQCTAYAVRAVATPMRHEQREALQARGPPVIGAEGALSE